jgi:hypothetical protein
LTKDEIKNLSDSGHVIAAHTWESSHGNEIYRRRLEYTTSKTEEKLEDITGKPVTTSPILWLME